MDLNIVWTLGFVVVAIAFIFGVLYLKKKGMVDSEDIKVLSQTLNISLAVLAELNLKQEKEIQKIGGIIWIALNSASNLYDTKDKDKIILVGKDFAFKLCEEQKIELTDSRKILIVQLLELALNESLLSKVQ